jgi:hypothetical protein
MPADPRPSYEDLAAENVELRDNRKQKRWLATSKIKNYRYCTR